MNDKETKKILMVGGGTGGSVAPLLAIAAYLRERQKETNWQFFWLGTNQGPEKEMVAFAHIPFSAIYAAKLRRYWSWENLFIPFFLLIGFGQALYYIFKEKPDLVMNAGSFVGVPVVWAAWFGRVPVLIHQQDARVSLSNRLTAPLAKVVTVAMEKSLADFGGKAFWTGNPIRLEFFRQNSALPKHLFALNFFDQRPLVLALGGGTGAVALNEQVAAAAASLPAYLFVLVTGRGKQLAFAPDNLRAVEFVDAAALSALARRAVLVISRCGLNVLTELALLGKPAILIPMPASHQEDNAVWFFEARAALVMDQSELTAERLAQAVRKVMTDDRLRRLFSQNIRNFARPDANEKIADIARDMLG